MNTFILPIGDWSWDGHKQTAELHVRTNKTKKELIEAYLKTEELLNMTFDHNREQNNETKVLLSDFKGKGIHADTMAILLHHGVDIGCATPCEEGYYWFSAEDTAELFMEFIKISLPSLEYRLIDNRDDYLFGYWGELNLTVGYGCGSFY